MHIILCDTLVPRYSPTYMVDPVDEGAGAGAVEQQLHRLLVSLVTRLDQRIELTLYKPYTIKSKVE